MFEGYRAYMNDNPEGYWFKAKLYGWGWTPVTWQGWGITGLYLLSILAFSFTLDETSPPREVMFTFVLPVFFLTLLLIRICYRTGEKPRWRWGLPDKYKTKK
jgi:hypothetical protein